MRQAWPAHPEVPISKAVRAGDFVFTSAYGPWTFDPEKVVFDDDGCDPRRRQRAGGHAVRRAGAPDVGLHQGGARRRRLHARRRGQVRVLARRCARLRRLQQIYRTYFTKDPPVRSIFPVRFMFACKVEMQVVAYRPSGRTDGGARQGLAGRHLRGRAVSRQPRVRCRPGRGLPPELLRALGTQFGGVTAVLGPNQGEALRLRFVTADGTPSGCRSCRRGGGRDSPREPARGRGELRRRLAAAVLA